MVQQINGDSNNGLTIGSATGGTTINVAGIEGNRLISGVAAGIADNDAVNLAQLTAAIANVSPGVATSSNNTSNLDVANASGTDSLASGYGARATGNKSVALGNNSLTTGTNSVALGYGSSDEGRDNVVSVGSSGNERQITNVAPGMMGTDAVNLNQLNKVANEANAGVAAAMAFAALPQSVIPGKYLISGGYGNFQGESAFAIGASSVLGEGKFLIKAGGSITARGDGGGSLGFGLQF